MNDISTIATSALLIELNISLWAGKKRDKGIAAEVTKRAQATSSTAASVVKNLLGDDADHDRIKAHAMATRLYLQKHTFAWNDSGSRLLPTALVLDVTSELASRIEEFNALVATFLQSYQTKISVAAFKLGSLFDRSEYPTEDEIARKFSMDFKVFPVPTENDFRINVQEQTAEFLREKFQKDAEARVAEMLREPWGRIYEQLAHILERLNSSLLYDPNAEGAGKPPRLFQSMLDNAVDLANLLDKMNITKDPQLSACSCSIKQLFSEEKIDALREDTARQMDLKGKVEGILSAFTSLY